MVHCVHVPTTRAKSDLAANNSILRRGSLLASPVQTLTLS